VNDGEARCYQASYTLDLRATEDPDAHSRGFLGMLSAERAGRWGLDGDFRYDRYVADFRHYSKLGPQIYLDVRLMGGALEPVSDVHYLYPVHKEFYVGGIGTLPGYSYKAFRGERMMLANAEYRFGDRPAFLLTADAGDAWTPGEREFELHTDVGAGFELSAEELRIMVGRRLDEPDADPIWRLRLNRTF
jgi:outer membrane protein assembly factor BamA